MADSLVQTVISGLISGGAGAATTMLAFFKEMRGRIERLEKSVGTQGSAVEPRTGLYLLVAQLGDQVKIVEDALKTFKREVDRWEDDPPDWLTRALNRRAAVTSFNAEQFEEFETRVEQRVKLATDRVKRLEDALARVQEQVETLPDRFTQESDRFVDVDTYELESRKRADDIRRIQENLNTANGFLRGVMAALGYLDPPPASPPMPPTPPTLPRRGK